jgi:hypothetical protein
MSTDLATLVAPFRDTVRYHRTGILLVPSVPSPRVSQFANALPGDIVSWPNQVVAALRDDQRWVDSRPQVILTELRTLSEAPSNYVGFVVEGLDFVLARWDREEVTNFWREFLELRRNAPRAVVAVLPIAATHLFPHSEDLETFRTDRRLVEFT